MHGHTDGGVAAECVADDTPACISSSDSSSAGDFPEQETSQLGHGPCPSLGSEASADLPWKSMSGVRNDLQLPGEPCRGFSNNCPRETHDLPSLESDWHGMLQHCGAEPMMIVQCEESGPVKQPIDDTWQESYVTGSLPGPWSEIETRNQMGGTLEERAETQRHGSPSPLHSQDALCCAGDGQRADSLVPLEVLLLS